MAKLWKKVLALGVGGCLVFGATACELFNAPEEESSSSPTIEQPEKPQQPQQPQQPSVQRTVTSVNGVIEVAGADMKFVLETEQDGVETGETEGYLIDGFVYVQDAESGAFLKSPSSLWSEIFNETGLDQEGVDELFGAFSQMEGVSVSFDAVQTLFGDFADIAFTQKDAVTTVTIDAKDGLNEVFDYVGSLTAQTTVGDVVNDALALFDSSFTYQTAFEDLLAMKNVTLNELYSEYNELLQTETGMSLQQVKDELLANPVLESVLVETVGEETLLDWKDIVLSEVVEQNANLTVEDMLVSLFVAEEDADVTLETVLQNLETDVLKTTLGELDADLVATFASFALMDVSAFSLNVSYTEVNGVWTTLEINFVVAIQVKLTAMAITEIAVETAVSLKSVEKVELPESAEIILSCYDCGGNVEVAWCEICQKYLCSDCEIEHAQ